MKTNLLLILACITLLIFPNIVFGQPDLGATSPFAIFSATGAITNSGVTTITGDVGTNTGAYETGTPPIVIGTVHVSDPTSASAAVDVAGAYADLSAIPCTNSTLTGLGNNQVLTEGVYCLGAALEIQDNIILDGQNNPDALFVFKINGALSTTQLSEIILINGASLSNVYWQINGAFNLGIGAHFRGTVITTGEINLLTGSSIQGRGLSTAGAINLHTNILVRPAAEALPVTLVSFTAKAQANHTVDLALTTSQETNNKGFLIERSKDMKQFDTVGEVGEVSVNSNSLKNYRLTDHTPYAGTSYYRLTQTDIDGKSTVYRAVSVILRDEKYGVFPNPVSNDGRFTLRLDEPETANLSFYGVDGRSLPLYKTGVQSGNLQLKSTGNLLPGFYVLKVSERGQTRYHRLIVK